MHRRPDTRRTAPGARGGQLFAGARRDAVPRGRVGLGQVAHGALDHAPSVALASRSQRLRHARRTRAHGTAGACHAPAARWRCRHDLPGADDVAQSGHDDRGAVDRGHSHPRRSPGGRARHSEAGRVHRASLGHPRRRVSRGPRPRHARCRAHHRTGAAHGAISARALGRHAAARDDRHGAVVPSQGADRRRTHDRARRDGAGSDPDADARAQGRVRHVHPSHHPRYGGGGRDGRPRRRAEDRSHGRARLRRRHFRATPARLHQDPARGRTAARQPSRPRWAAAPVRSRLAGREPGTGALRPRPRRCRMAAAQAGSARRRLPRPP